MRLYKVERRMPLKGASWQDPRYSLEYLNIKAESGAEAAATAAEYQHEAKVRLWGPRPPYHIGGKRGS